MAAPRKFDEQTRRRILELHIHERRSAADVAHILEQDGTPISPETVRSIAKAERLRDVTERPKAEQLRILLAGIVQATNWEITSIQAKSPDDAPERLLKLAQTIKTIEPLLTEKPAGKDQQKTPATLGMLTNNNNTNAA